MSNKIIIDLVRICEMQAAALGGFSKYCIKPDCKCWACETQSAIEALLKESETK